MVTSIEDELGVLLDKVGDGDGDMELVRVRVGLSGSVLASRNSTESLDGLGTVLVVLLCRCAIESGPRASS